MYRRNVERGGEIRGCQNTVGGAQRAWVVFAHSCSHDGSALTYHFVIRGLLVMSSASTRGHILRRSSRHDTACTPITSAASYSVTPPVRRHPSRRLHPRTVTLAARYPVNDTVCMLITTVASCSVTSPVCHHPSRLPPAVPSRLPSLARLLPWPAGYACGAATLTPTPASPRIRCLNSFGEQ